MTQTLKMVEDAISMTRGERDYHAKNVIRHENSKVWNDSDRLRDCLEALTRLEKIKIMLENEMKVEVCCGNCKN